MCCELVGALAETRMGGTLIGIGELLWDCFPDARRPGGAPANVAFHASQLGLRGTVCARVGRDDLGDELVRHLTAHGLDAGGVQRDDEHPTGTVSVHIGAGGPSYTIHEGVAWDYLAWEPRLAALGAAADAVCFGTLAQRCPISRETIRRCVAAAAGAWRIYDVNLRPPFYERGCIDASLQLCRVVKLNHEELSIVAALLEIPGESQTAQAAALRQRFALELVCVTRGAEGCVLVGANEMVEVAGRPIAVVDTVGAGDAFTAALAAGLVERWPWAAVGRFANEVGGLVASRAGAMPELRDELTRLRVRYAANAQGA